MAFTKLKYFILRQITLKEAKAKIQVE